jgi:hypothetical protein
MQNLTGPSPLGCTTTKCGSGNVSALPLGAVASSTREFPSSIPDGRGWMIIASTSLRCPPCCCRSWRRRHAPRLTFAFDVLGHAHLGRRRRSLSLMWICARACLCVKSVGPVRAQFAPVLWTRLRPFSPTRGRHRNVRVGVHQTLAPCKFFSRFLHRRINVRVINSEAEFGIVS